MLELSGIHKYYNPGTINEMCLFDNFSMKIEQGDFLSVVGSNGSYITIQPSFLTKMAV